MGRTEAVVRHWVMWAWPLRWKVSQYVFFRLFSIYGTSGDREMPRIFFPTVLHRRRNFLCCFRLFSISWSCVPRAYVFYKPRYFALVG